LTPSSPGDYLDGVRYPIITERGTRLAALQAGRLDTSMPLEMTKIMAETAKKNVPSLVVATTGQIGSDNVVLNHKRPPFDNVTIRRAIGLAMDRHDYIKAVRQGGAAVGAALMPGPFGAWGLLDKDLRTLAGYRGSAVDKADAKRLLAEAGFGPGKPLRVELVTRSFAIYVDLASFVVDQLRQVGVEATLKQLETSAWFPALARRDYQIGANLTAAAIDDPDAYLYENYRCGASRNYTDYCSEEMDRLMDQQSQELNRDKRRKLVWDIQRKLESDVARPMLGWRYEYFTQWPYVRNLVPHHSLYNYGRMQDVWLDK
jgi:peptide/nickel transport system substrate-binding protein